MKIFLFFFFTFFFFFLLVVSVIHQEINPEIQLEEIPEEKICEDQVWMENEPLTRKFISRTWLEPVSYDQYCAQYFLDEKEKILASENRENIKPNNRSTYKQYWKTVYSRLYEHDKFKIKPVADSLQHVAIKLELNQEKLLHLLFSFVQDIPYEFMLPDECAENENAPCNSFVQFGLYAPVEFLYSLSGDCDTRTVLLYTLLKNFGYKPLIVNSLEYKHSMIAIGFPFSGDFINHKGRKYYFWETTAEGWLPGMLPPDMDHIPYWQVILDAEDEN